MIGMRQVKSLLTQWNRYSLAAFPARSFSQTVVPRYISAFERPLAENPQQEPSLECPVMNIGILVRLYNGELPENPMPVEEAIQLLENDSKIKNIRSLMR